MEDGSLKFEEILEIIKRVRPEWKMSHINDCHDKNGKGFVSASVLTFFKDCYLWITFLCEPNTFAYKHVSSEWVGIYSGLIVASPSIFVEYDKHHKICGWSATQAKTCPGCKG